MRVFVIALALLAGIYAAAWGDNPSTGDVKITKDTITWLTWEEAIEKMKEEPKKLFVDVYTDWCGWCKKMDASTFKDPDVVKYMSEHFYAVKLDAEQKEDIIYKNNTFKFVAQGRRGYHQLAASLLNGKMSYPSFVYLNEKEERIAISPGYKDASAMLKELKKVENGELR